MCIYIYIYIFEYYDIYNIMDMVPSALPIDPSRAAGPVLEIGELPRMSQQDGMHDLNRKRKDPDGLALPKPIRITICHCHGNS